MSTGDIVEWVRTKVAERRQRRANTDAAQTTFAFDLTAPMRFPLPPSVRCSTCGGHGPTALAFDLRSRTMLATHGDKTLCAVLTMKTMLGTP